MSVALRRLRAKALDEALPEVARLRLRVFREWPYLYDGDMAYETGYLEPYRNNASAILIGAFDGDHLIGAATGMTMEDHADAFSTSFGEAGKEMTDIFYCAESVLLPEYRGQGIGHQFFDMREDHARGLGRAICAFCAVIRHADHPQRPDEYRSLEPFWRKRGYAPLAGAVAQFHWKDVGQAAQSAKSLQFWTRAL